MFKDKRTIKLGAEIPNIPKSKRIEMKAVFDNIYEFNESAINIPFTIDGSVVGYIIEVNKETFTCMIWDKFTSYKCDFGTVNYKEDIFKEFCMRGTAYR